MADEHLDLAYDCSAGTSVWRTSLDEQGEPVPYTYVFSLAAPTITATRCSWTWT